MKHLRLLGLVTAFLCTLFVQAQDQYAINLDGTDDYANGNFSLGTGASFTIESWINYNSIANNTAILGQNGVLEISFNNNRLYAYINTNVGWLNTSFLIDASFLSGTWNHIAVTGNGTTLAIFINGVQKTTFTSGWTSLASNANTFNMGGHTQNPFVYLNGKLDEIRVWNIARTQVDIKANMFRNLAGNTAGLQAYFNSNEGTGTALSNATGGSNGTLLNGAGFIHSPVRFASNALAFDGVDDMVVTSLNLSGSTAFTLEGWIYPVSITNTTALFGQNDVLEFGLHNGSLAGWTGWGGSLSWNFNATTFPLNTWHHVAFTGNGSTLFLYVDGQQVSTANYPAPSGYGNSSFTFKMGRKVWDDNNDNNFNGNMDEIRVWNVARTLAQIQETMYTELNPAAYSGLLAYYTFNQGIAAGNNTGLTIIPDLKNNNPATLTNFALNGTNSNFTGQNPSLIVLPLQWKEFIAIKKMEEVLLNWKTNSEFNTASFGIEHRIPGTHWTTIGNLPASGISNQVREYSFRHTNPVIGSNQYRIRQVDLDGKFSYSPVATVQFSSALPGTAIFPNPTTGKLTLTNLKTGDEIWVTDMLGHILMKTNSPGNNHLINLQTLTEGMYIIMIYRDQQRINQWRVNKIKN